MTRLPLPLLAGALLACATPRSAGTRAGDDHPPRREVRETASGERLVCQRERVTGTNLRKRVCRYERDRRQQREAAQTIVRERSQNAKPGEGP